MKIHTVICITLEESVTPLSSLSHNRNIQSREASVIRTHADTIIALHHLQCYFQLQKITEKFQWEIVVHIGAQRQWNLPELKGHLCIEKA